MTTDDPSLAPEAPQKWPFTSPYYNPMTMRSSILEELNDYLIYAGYHISCISLKNKKVTADIDLKLQDQEARRKFTAVQRSINPDASVFFISHVFSHRMTKNGSIGDMRFTLSLDKPSWIWLLEEMNIHPKFVESLYYLLGNFSTFVTYSDDGKSAESIHVLIKAPPAGHLEAAFYLRYDFLTQKTFALVAGNDLTGHTRSLIEHFSELQGKSHPFGIIYTVVYRYFYFLEWQRRQLDHSVIMMERVTGRGAVTYSGGQLDDPDPEHFDLNNMHWIGGNQRNIIFAMEFQVKLLDFLQRAHYQFVSLNNSKPVSFNEMQTEEKYMQEALQSHRITVSGVLDNCRVIGERAQWQLNTADSLVNTWIAKQSQRTADESKNIAVETRRDSTSMKTIASLTMVYLPSTFVATMFSTGFFTGANGVGTLTVSPEIWKFAVIAAILTILTVFVWVYLNKRGVPFFLRWANSGLPKQVGTQKKASPAAPILLNLPQMPGDKANHLVPEHDNGADRSSEEVGTSTRPVAPKLPVTNDDSGEKIANVEEPQILLQSKPLQVLKNKVTPEQIV